MFDYIYSDSKEKFSFIKLPCVLFTDERFSSLTSDMKLLYALMLDRISLSIKHHWYGKDGRVFINYPVTEIMEKLHVANQKAGRLLRELEKAGLIERVRMGLGKPDRIFVKNCCKEMTAEEKPAEIAAEIVPVENCAVTELQPEINADSDLTVCETPLPEPVKPDVQKCENAPVTLYNNQTNRTIRNHSDPIHPDDGRTDGIERRRAYEKLVKDNIEYDWFRDVFTLPSNEPQRPKGTIEELDDIVSIMVDSICSRAKTLRVGGQNVETDVVRSRLLKLNSEHIQFVFDRIYGFVGEITNYKAYMLTVLYNATMTLHTAFGMNFRATFGC